MTRSYSPVASYRIRQAKRPNRLAVAYLWWLETACELTGHAYACLLLNSSQRSRAGRAWRRVLEWLYEAADDMTPWVDVPGDATFTDSGTAGCV